jgi:hypothetical protein
VWRTGEVHIGIGREGGRSEGNRSLGISRGRRENNTKMNL